MSRLKSQKTKTTSRNNSVWCYLAQSLNRRHLLTRRHWWHFDMTVLMQTEWPMARQHGNLWLINFAAMRLPYCQYSCTTGAIKIDRTWGYPVVLRQSPRIEQLTTTSRLKSDPSNIQCADTEWSSRAVQTFHFPGVLQPFLRLHVTAQEASQLQYWNRAGALSICRACGNANYVFL